MKRFKNTETIKVKVTENQLPLRIDLNMLFACKHLKFQVTVENLGAVEAALSPTSGHLELSRLPKAYAGASTRVTVRAFDLEGDSVSAAFAVQLSSEAVLIQQVRKHVAFG